MRLPTARTSLALATVLAACGGGSSDNTDNPMIDAAAGTPDGSSGTPDGSSGTPDSASGTPDAEPSPDAEMGSPDAAPPADPVVWVRGDFVTDNTNDIAVFDQNDDAPPTLAVVSAAGSVGEFDVSADGTVVTWIEAGAVRLRLPGAAATDLVADDPDADVTNVAISPDGTMVAFRADLELAGMFDIYLADSNGFVKVSPDRAVNDISLDAATVMAWSPDGQYLTFGGRFTDANKNELRGWGVAAGTPFTLIGAADIDANVVAGQPTPGYILAPQFVGDRVIVQARLTADDKRYLYTVNLDGTGLDLVGNALLSRGDDSTAEVWTYGVSPDGTTLVFAADGIVAGAFELYAMPADDSAAAVRLTSGDVLVGREVNRFDPLAFSPDGTQVAFHAEYGATADKFEPYVTGVGAGAVNAGELHRLAVIGGAANDQQDSTGPLAWSADGTKVYAIADHQVNNDSELYALTATDTDGTPVLLVDAPAGGDVFSIKVRP
jgi:Tol biopolymer transport system component